MMHRTDHPGGDSRYDGTRRIRITLSLPDPDGGTATPCRKSISDVYTSPSSTIIVRAAAFSALILQACLS